MPENVSRTSLTGAVSQPASSMAAASSTVVLRIGFLPQLLESMPYSNPFPRFDLHHLHVRGEGGVAHFDTVPPGAQLQLLQRRAHPHVLAIDDDLAPRRNGERDDARRAGRRCGFGCFVARLLF